MRFILLLLCCVAPVWSFAPNVAPSASRPTATLGRHYDARCHVSVWDASRPWSASCASSDSGRRPLISRLMSARADDGGGGDTPGEISAEIRAAGIKIEAIEEEIEAIKDALSGGPPYLGITDRDVLFEEKKQLQEEKKQLQGEKKQLRDEKLVLLKKPATAAVSLSAPKMVAGFGAALTEAVVTNNTLELANDTFFLGDPLLGSKIYIRPCYKELSALIFGGSSSGSLRSVVVTGTPGIGKSVFGFCLLHELRCDRITVVFERKSKWYRFSDEGVVKGNFDVFNSAGYMDDPNSWYLSDPEDRPKEGFAGTTVVLVSPTSKKVNEFLKQAKSVRLFMPVWSLDELLECRRAVFPDVPETDVRERFGKVGGVARAVFDAEKLRGVCRKMQTAASNIDLSFLQQILSRGLGDTDQVSTDRSGDALLHLLPTPGTGFKEFSVDFASEYAHNVTIKELPKKELTALASFVRAAFANDELGAKVVAERAALFESIAHKTIGGPDEQQQRKGFDMRILSSANSSTESVLEGDPLRFNFLREKSFEGNSFPDTLVTGTYYRPGSKSFPAIDSFGVDSGSRTLWFFQMKSAGLPPKKGEKAVKWNHVEDCWRSAKILHGAPIKNCVYAFVLPEGEIWNKAIKTNKKDGGGDWLTGGLKSACDVCVIEMPL